MFQGNWNFKYSVNILSDVNKTWLLLFNYSLCVDCKACPSVRSAHFRFSTPVAYFMPRELCYNNNHIIKKVYNKIKINIKYD